MTDKLELRHVPASVLEANTFSEPMLCSGSIRDLAGNGRRR